jgi:ribose 5-phosphate isomerase A
LDQGQLKQQVAEAALEEIRGELHADSILGVGTGTTADRFIDLLGQLNGPLKGAVASSERSAARLRARGIRVFELHEIDRLALYVDGADEINLALDMIKGGGGALTREKIVAAASDRFICIADGSKLVDHLGKFGVPIEVIPMATRQLAVRLKEVAAGLGAPRPELRLAKDGSPYVTDNGNHIIDLRGLVIAHAAQLETAIDGLVGVVCNGLFARRGADVLLLARPLGVERYLRHA